MVRFGKYEHVTPVLHDLHWLPIELCVYFKVLHYTYKILNEHSPPFTCDIIVIYKPAKPLRYAAKICLFQKLEPKVLFTTATLWDDLQSSD